MKNLEMKRRGDKLKSECNERFAKKVWEDKDDSDKGNRK